MTLTSPTGQIETWRLQHFDEKNGWSGPDLEDLYVSYLNILFHYSSLTVISIFDNPDSK